MTHKIVISDCDHKDINIEKSVFADAGFDCDWRECVTEDEVINGCADANVLIIQYARLSRKVLESLPNLKQVVRYGVGYDTVDVIAAKEMGVQVCNVPDYGTNEVADQAMAHTLCLVRKLYMTNSDVRRGRWNFIDTVPIRRMSCMTVGIIGLGRIGSQYAKRMNAFGVNIFACEIKSMSVPDYVKMVSFDELIRSSDIISVHCPAQNNIDLIGEKEFAKMKDGVILINVSRGGIVNEPALLAALSSKKLAGCGLDVAEKEPLATDNPLLGHSNLTISPHMAWYSEESAAELKRKVAEEVVRFIKGEAVHYSVIG